MHGGRSLKVAVDPRQDGSAFVCVCGRAAAANCETGPPGNRSLQVAKQTQFAMVRRRNVVQDGCAIPPQQKSFPHA
jgi:hypothetical protein